MLTMIAEAIAHGLRLYEADIAPPSVDSAWLEPLMGRWVGMIAEACGIDIDIDINAEVDEEIEEIAYVSVPTFLEGGLSDDGYDAKTLKKEAWFWDLQTAAVEGAYHATALYEARFGGDEILTLSSPTAAWFDKLEQDDWECSLPLLLPPRVDDLNAWWLAVATFEFAVRTGIPELMDTITALEAANRALRFVAIERLANPDAFYTGGPAIETLTAEDFADWLVE
ncbi:hypothetical protein [Gemmatimonas sp.]|uniref:hypothetical protein n=1 Tax=Gemmatimonas sp. TaxID=1962908 RepID=UPI0037C0AACD